MPFTVKRIHLYGALNQISQSNLFCHKKPHANFAQIHISSVRNLRQQTSKIIPPMVKIMSYIRAVFSPQTIALDIPVYSTRRSFPNAWSCDLNWSVQCVQSLWHSDWSSLSNFPQTKRELICQL